VGSPKRLQRVEVLWIDIESEAGWGEGNDEIPTVLQIGYVHSYPTDKRPYYKIKFAQCEETPGGMSIIPKGNVVKLTYLGWADVPWRKS
jgi:hypothetical protein